MSIVRAAERCGISQAALSIQVQKVERVLGVQLFNRNRRRVEITVAGQAIVSVAEQILEIGNADYVDNIVEVDGEYKIASRDIHVVNFSTVEASPVLRGQ